MTPWHRVTSRTTVVHGVDARPRTPLAPPEGFEPAHMASKANAQLRFLVN